MFALERARVDRPVRWTGLLGLLLIPVIVAGAFLWATWDADQRLDQVRAAVVNLDEPVTIDDQLVPLGRQLAGGLVGGATDRTVEGQGLQNITWVLSDEDDATAGLRDGRYAAVVTIPKNFSSAATSYAQADTARHATIDVQTSPTSKLADPVIARAVAAVAVDTTNQLLTENYLDQVYVGFNDTREGMQELADGTEQLASGAGQLADGVNAASDGTSQLSAGLSQLSAGSPQLRSGTGQLATGARQLSNGLGQLDAQLAANPGMDTSQLDALASGSAQLRAGTAHLRDGTGQLADGAAGLDAGLLAYQSGIGQIAANGLVDPGTGQPVCPPQIQAAGPQACGIFLEGTKAGASAAVAGLSTPDPRSGATLLDGSAALAAGTRQLHTQTGPLADGTAQLDAGIQLLVPQLKALPGQMKQLSDGVHQLAVGADQVADGADQLAAGTARYTGGVDQVAAGAGTLADGMSQLGGGSDELAAGTQDLAKGVSDGLDKAPVFDEADRERLSGVVSRPVSGGELTTPGAGSWVALVVGLALWLAGLATFLVLQAVPGRALGSSAGTGRLLTRALWPALLVAAVQAGVVFLVARSALQTGGDRLWAVVALLALVAVTASVVNHALVVWLGGFGRVLSVAFAVLAVASSLTAAIPTLLADLRPYLPLTPAIDGLRNLLVGDPVGGSVGLLLVWLLGALLASLLGLARKRTVTAEALVARFA